MLIIFGLLAAIAGITSGQWSLFGVALIFWAVEAYGAIAERHAQTENARRARLPKESERNTDVYISSDMYDGTIR